MGKIIYNKLVRDKIPEIIKENGSTVSMRLLGGKGYYEELEEYIRWVY